MNEEQLSVELERDKHQQCWLHSEPEAAGRTPATVPSHTDILSDLQQSSLEEPLPTVCIHSLKGLFIYLFLLDWQIYREK